MGPISVAGVQLCWRWDPLSGHMVINFLQSSSRLGWRWDELKPDGDASSLVTEWHGVAHVGSSTFSYTMSLVDAESWSQHVDSWKVSDSAVDLSLRVTRGSVY